METRLGDALYCVTPAEDAPWLPAVAAHARGRESGRQMFERLTQSGVVADLREPDILRVAPAPLYNSFADVAAFVDRLEQALPRSA
jgi:kynureninase